MCNSAPWKTVFSLHLVPFTDAPRSCFVKWVIAMAIIFFDIGSTLASVGVAADGSLTFKPLPRVIEALGTIGNTRKGIISNPGPGDAALAKARAALTTTFGAYFTDHSLVHWGPKNSRHIFDHAISKSGELPNSCIFIGEDPQERQFANEAGLRTAPHPIFCLAALERRSVFWVRINIPANRNLAELEAVVNANEIVPVHVGSDHLVLSAATTVGVVALEQAGFSTDVRGQVDETAAYLIRDDRDVSIPDSIVRSSDDTKAMEATLRSTAAFAFVASQFTGLTSSVTSLGPAAGGVYLAAPATTPIEEIHIPGAKHGHTELLLFDPGLLSRPGEATVKGLANSFTGTMPSEQTFTAVRESITSEVMRGHVAWLTGVDPIIDRKELKIRSRDVACEHNMVVVDALARRFRSLGLAVHLNEFFFRGKRLANVEAEYRVEGSDAIVLVSAHLDSTAAGGEYFDENGLPRPYNPATDPAPGADDDASGMAAVIAAAECLGAIVATGRRPGRSIRFVLFNAEEQGLIGSKVYARGAAAAGDKIAGVLQMDMIGGFQGGRKKVEIHAGAAVLGPVISASNSLGDLVTQAVKAVAPDFEVERLTGSSDRAIGRSDHASFQERGWAAVAISENFFDDTAPATGTRQYHKPGDTLNDKDHSTDYAAEIARAVALAALTMADR